MFYFVEDFPLVEQNVKAVIVSKRILGTRMLFKRFKVELLFPDWFGYNFHVFYDIMTQLYYNFPEKEVRIYHQGLPLLLPKDMKEYLDWLNLIDVEWERFAERADITRAYAEKHPERYTKTEGITTWWNEQPKIFNVYFRKRDESYVKDILSKYSWDYRQCISFDETGADNIDYIKHYSIE